MDEQIMETLNDTVDEVPEDIDVIIDGDLITEDDGFIKGILATLGIFATAGITGSVIYKNWDKLKGLKKKRLEKKIKRLVEKYENIDGNSEDSVEEEHSVDCEPVIEPEES